VPSNRFDEVNLVQSTTFKREAGASIFQIASIKLILKAGLVFLQKQVN
jgi:hypothetical protein